MSAITTTVRSFWTSDNEVCVCKNPSVRGRSSLDCVQDSLDASCTYTRQLVSIVGSRLVAVLGHHARAPATHQFQSPI